MASRPGIYGLVAEFENPAELIAAVRAAYRAGYRKMDAYTPFPIEEVSDALGFQRTRMPLVVFLGGVVGCFCGFAMQYWCNVVDYPINVGGRPLNSWPSFVPVTFEMTVLIASLAGVFGLLALCGLPMPYHPLFNVERFARASRDRFFLCIEARDSRFDREGTKQFLAGLTTHPVLEVPH